MPVNLKRDDMGDVIKDFYKSDAPQFKGKSKKKRRQMAIAAKLNAEEATDIHDADGNLYATVIDIIKPTTMKLPEPSVKWKDLTEQKVTEGKSFADFRKNAASAMQKAVNRKKKVLTKHQYPPGASGGDAGERAAKVVRDKDHRKYVNFLPSDD
tara:strand:- start:417 stop:878 length:462 start_codon:yes stop_codon:yes gene_type:complete